MDQIKNKSKKITRQTLIGLSILFISIIVILLTSLILYNRTSQILDTNLRQRLLSIVTTAVVGFDANDVQQLRVEDDWKKPEWTKIVHQMEKIRRNNPNILFVYMFRKADADPTKMEFVSDSHSTDPYAKIDINNDGVIDDGDQLQWPGQAYETAPPEAFEAYNGPITNKDIYSDQWGPVLTGYAPIKDSEGNTVAVMAVDIKAGDFSTITKQTLQPFLVFIASLSFIISLLILIIVVTSKRYTKILEKINSQLEVANEQQTTLIHFISHEIKGFLSKSRNIFSFILDGEYGPMPEYLEVPSREGLDSGTKGVDMVQEILNAANLKKGTIQYKMEKFDLKPLLESVISDLKNNADSRGLSLETKITDGENFEMMGDSEQIKHVLKNLIDNSIKYTLEGGLVTSLSKNNSKILFSVKDTGVGINPDDRAGLFIEGVRGKDSLKVNVDSTGYGLFIAKKIVEAHHGRIWALSDGPGHGSTFSVELPQNQ